MSKELIVIFIIAMALMVMQMVGGFFQIKRYRLAVSRVHKLGNVGIGQKRGFSSIVTLRLSHVIRIGSLPVEKK